jgi:hypothetical protein
MIGVLDGFGTNVWNEYQNEGDQTFPKRSRLSKRAHSLNAQRATLANRRHSGSRRFVASQAARRWSNEACASPRSRAGAGPATSTARRPRASPASSSRLLAIFSARSSSALVMPVGRRIEEPSVDGDFRKRHSKGKAPNVDRGGEGHTKPRNGPGCRTAFRGFPRNL